MRGSPPDALNIIFVGILPPHPGGGAISSAGLLAELAALGYTVRALAPATADSPAESHEWCRAHPAVRVSRFSVPYYHIGPIAPADPAYLRRQREAIQTLLPGMIADDPPDVLFVGRESFVADVVDIARASAIPCILRLPGGMTLGVLKGNYPEALAREFLDACRSVQRIVSPARHLAARARALGLDAVTVIPNAVDTELFSPRPKSPTLLHSLGIPRDTVVVAHLSNLKAIKRAMDVVTSAAQALLQDSRLVYLVVGDGSDRRPMEEACRRAGIQQRVRFVGWVDYPRVPDYINLADIVVMPSEDEGLARVYLETQACGRVLLASDIPAAREVVVDERTGLLFRTGDIPELTAKTLRLAADPGLRAAIGQNARAQTRRYRLPEAALRYARLMGELVHRDRPLVPGRAGRGVTPVLPRPGHPTGPYPTADDSASPVGVG